eukprot:6437866-Prymnesium_polylepis.1
MHFFVFFRAFGGLCDIFGFPIVWNACGNAGGGLCSGQKQSWDTGFCNQGADGMKSTTWSPRLTLRHSFVMARRRMDAGGGHVRRERD